VREREQKKGGFRTESSSSSSLCSLCSIPRGFALPHMAVHLCEIATSHALPSVQGEVYGFQ
jgi:hypothetical protein